MVRPVFLIAADATCFGKLSPQGGGSHNPSHNPGEVCQ
jgi:hypothetical protein